MKWYPSASDASCVRVNANGNEFEDFSCLYPSLGRSYQPFELAYNPAPLHFWMLGHPVVPVAGVLAYAAFIVLGQRYFATKKPWDWRNTMALWNLGLSAFSAIGFVRVAPVLLHIFTHYSLRENFCFDPESHFASFGATGLWMQLFILSKIPELFDTFFIVVHKKQLIFLHWYHHMSVLIYCWYSYAKHSPTGIIFCVMNYAVHAIMYFYYFLMAVKCKPKSFKAVYITGAQISQMVVGVAVTLFGCYLSWWEKQPEGCMLSTENNVAALVMYGSYLFLFLQFFFQRYQINSISKASKLNVASDGTTTSNSSIKEE